MPCVPCKLLAEHDFLTSVRGGEGGTTSGWVRNGCCLREVPDSTVGESGYGTQLSPPSEDNGIIIEKEISKEELLAILELYHEVRGASSDVTRLLDTLAQMEKYQVRGHRPCSGKGEGPAISGWWHPCKYPWGGSGLCGTAVGPMPR